MFLILSTGRHANAATFEESSLALYGSGWIGNILCYLWMSHNLNKIQHCKYILIIQSLISNQLMIDQLVWTERRIVSQIFFSLSLLVMESFKCLFFFFGAEVSDW